jgi:putative FmdB family regulatory protein
MPIYEYECKACGHTFEEWQKMSDKPVRVCPKCKARKVEKLISHTSFQLKGGGWYSDLYASQKPAASTSESSTDKSAAASTTESSGDKSAAKATSDSSSSTSKPAEGKGNGKGKKGASKAAA